MSLLPDRYIKLSGYPLDTPPVKAFYQSTGFKTGVFCSAFNSAGHVILNGSENLHIILPVLVITPIFVSVVNKFAEAALIDRTFKTNSIRMPYLHASRQLVLDTRPPENTRTADQYIAGARWVRNIAVGMTTINASGPFLTAASMFYAAGGSVSNMVLQVCLMAGIVLPSFIQWKESVQRFHKVVKGEYAIKDHTSEKAPYSARVSGLVPALN